MVYWRQEENMPKAATVVSDQEVRSRANALYRDLRDRGFDCRAVVVLTAEMLALVQQELQERTR